jgi:hypothetical protein
LNASALPFLADAERDAFGTTVSSVQDVVTIRCVPDAAIAAGLFGKAFRAAPPDFPDHYVAVRVADEHLMGYMHMTNASEARLIGGLCVDEPSYRHLPKPHFERLRAAGGIARLLLMSGVLDSKGSAATFAYTGNRRSRELIERLGFRRVHDPYLFALWHSSPDLSAPALVSRVVDLGPF